VDVEGTVHIKSTYLQATVEDAVLAALDGFFDIDGDYVDFGKGIYLSDLYRLLDEIEGVDHVDLNPQMSNIILEGNEFPQMGIVSLTFSGGA
jgi:uncharacterized phage protein gp47/JayE